jgi:hypothetical protein
MSKKKYIETPEKLFELFQAYKDSRKPREIQKATAAGVKSEWHTPPLTMEGFENYCFQAVGSVDHYFRNTDNSYSAYLPICSHIKKLIRQDQIEGGMVGQYNPSITQRLNGLTEKQDVTTGGEKLNELTIKIVGGDSSD